MRGWSSTSTSATPSASASTASAASPSPGDYYGLYLYSYTSGATDLEGLTIEYAGQGQAALYMYLADPEIRDSTIRYSGSSGVYSYYGEPTISGSDISDNSGSGVECYTSTCLDETADSFANNTLTGNGGYPVTLYANHVAALDSSSSFAGNGNDVINVRGGTVADTSTWHAQDVPYLVNGDVYVQSSTSAPTLTIEDGTEVGFDGVSLYVGTSYDGNLVVDGHTQGVLFTSADASPARGDWDGLYFGYHADSGSAVDGLTLEYGGGGSIGAGVFFYYNQTDTIAVSNSTLRENEGTGAYAYYYAEPVFTDSTFSDNETYGVYVDTYSALGGDFTGNTLTGNGSYPMAVPAGSLDHLDGSSTHAGNGDDYVLVHGGTLAHDATLHALDVPYAVSADLYVQGSASPVLTVEDGVSVYFDKNAMLIVGASSTGDLVVDGDRTSGDGVLFTGLDGASAGSWDGLYLGYYSDSATVMAGFTVEGGGGNSSYPAGIYLYNAEPTLSDCLIQDNEGNGLYDYSSTDLAMSDCTVQGTVATGSGNGDGLYLNGTLTAWSANTITGNDRYPMVIRADEMVELDGSSVLSGNGEDYVFLASTAVSTSGTWQDVGVPYYAGAGGLNIYGSSAVPAEIVADGVEVLFPNSSDYLYVGYSGYGELTATHATFTSAEASPAAGDWGGVLVGYYAYATSLEGVTIGYGGASSSWPANLSCYYCTVSVVDSTLTDSLYYGIYGYGTYSVTESGNTYTNNASGDTYPSPL